MYELQNPPHLNYYFLIDCANETASSFHTCNDYVSTLLTTRFLPRFKRYKSIGTISKTQLNMYLAINPNMKIKDLILLLERSVPADAQGE